MRPPALLELLRRILAEHKQRGLEGGLQLVPVILAPEFDELDEADLPVQRLLDATARYADGAFADAQRMSLDPPPDLVADVVLVGALQGALTVERATGTDHLEVTETNPRDVVFGGADVTVASDGARELLGIARALLSDQFTRHEFGLLTYSERNMDPLMQAACWDAVNTALRTPTVSMGSLRTLAIAVRVQSVNYMVHLDRTTGAHFVLEPTRLIRRSPWSSIVDVCTDLVARAGPVVFFLGAGFSRSSDLPLGDELRNQSLWRRYGESSESDWRPLAIRLFRDAQQQNALTDTERDNGEDVFADNLTLEQVVRIERTLFGDIPETLRAFAQLHESATAGTAVTRLAECLGEQPRVVLVAVNFDELIEGAGEGVRRFATDEEIAAFPDYLRSYLSGQEADVPLLKLHGTISLPETCIVDADQTEQGLPQVKRDALRAVREQTPENTPWLYVGASLRDVDVTPVLREQEFGEHFLESWVMPLRDSSIDLFAAEARSFWPRPLTESLEKRSLSASADDFMTELAHRIAARNA